MGTPADRTINSQPFESTNVLGLPNVHNQEVRPSKRSLLERNSLENSRVSSEGPGRTKLGMIVTGIYQETHFTLQREPGRV